MGLENSIEFIHMTYKFFPTSILFAPDQTHSVGFSQMKIFP